MAEKNSLWKNIRKKAEQNRRTGATPKKPTAEMLRQERKIKAKQYPNGGDILSSNTGSYYSPVSDTVYLDPNDNPSALGHELYHKQQHAEGRDRLPDYYDGPLRQPQTPTIDELAVNYYNRNMIDHDILNNHFLYNNPSFNFIPQDVVSDYYTDPAAYRQPWTLEGEARLSETPEGRAYLESKGIGVKQKADGGPVNTLEGDLISKVIMNRNRGKDFVQRAYAVGEYPESNMFMQPDANEFGQKNSHLMGWGEDKSGQAYMYPEVMNPNNEAIKVPNQYADYISSTGYKKATGMIKAQGGYVDGDDDKNKKNKTRVYTDPREFKKAKKAYNDSLSLYNVSNNKLKEYKDFDFGEDFEFKKYENAPEMVRGDDPLMDYWNGKNGIKPFQIAYDTNHFSKVKGAPVMPIFKKPEVKPILGKSSIDKLPYKSYTSSTEKPGIVGNVENISPSKINIDNFYEGQYEKYRRSPYEDSMYRVWVPGQQMQIVPEEQFKKLNDQYALKDLNQKSNGGYMYPDGGPTTSSNSPSNFDRSSKTTYDYFKKWYEGRAKNPKFTDVANSRLNLLNSGQYPETNILPYDQMTTEGLYTPSKNTIDYSDTDLNNKYYGDINTLMTHENDHWLSNKAPQEFLNISSGFSKDFKNNKGWLSGKDALTQDEEIRARLSVWRQLNNIDPTKNYSPKELRSIINKNLNDENLDSNVKDIYELIKGDAEKLKYLNDSFVSNNSKNNNMQYAADGGPIDDNRSKNYYRRNSAEYKDYLVRLRLNQFSKLPYYQKEYLLRQPVEFYDVFSDPDKLGTISDDEWNNLINVKVSNYSAPPLDDNGNFPYYTEDPITGEYGSPITYNYTTKIPEHQYGETANWSEYPYDDLDNPWNYNNLFKKYKPSKYHNQTAWEAEPLTNTYATTNLPKAPWKKNFTKEIEDDTNLIELQKYYPNLTKEELLDMVTYRRNRPGYITNRLDRSGDWKYEHTDVEKYGIDKEHDINWHLKRGEYYPESIANDPDQYTYPTPYWDEPSIKLEALPELEYLQPKTFKGFESKEESLKLNPIEMPFSPSKVLIREMGNLDKNRKKGEKGLPELYMDDKKGWRPIEWNDYEMYKQKYPGANTPEGWIRHDQKATGGYMYDGGGRTYANKQGVIMGPVQNPDGSYTVPVSNEGLPQVNLPEFEVALETNPYGPITGEEYLESNFNPINWILPSVEPEKPRFRPDGTLIPASGKIDPDYIEGDFIGIKKGKQAIDKFKNVDYEDFIKENTSANKLFNNQSNFGLFSSYKPSLNPTKHQSFFYDQKANFLKDLKTTEGSKRLQNLIDNNQHLKDLNLTPDDIIKDISKTNFVTRHPVHTLNVQDSHIEKQIRTLVRQGKINKKYLFSNRGKLTNPEWIVDNYGNKVNFDVDPNNAFAWRGSGRNLPGSISIGDNLTDPLGSFEHEILHLFQRNEQLKGIDDLIRNISTKSNRKLILEDLFRKKKIFDQKHYFRTGSNKREPGPFGAEIRIDLLRNGIIKNRYDPITPQMLKDHYKNYKNLNDSEIDLRIYNFMKNEDKNFDLLSEAMNNMPALLPTIGVGAAGVIGGAGAIQGSQPEQQSYGGPINPYMYYAGGPMQYEVGGKVWKNIAAGLYGAGEGILDTITMGATDQLTDRGFEYLTKVGNKNLDLNNPDDVKFLKTQQQVKGYSNAAGAIGTAVVTGNVQGAISQGTKGLNTAFQASDWASDDFKKWSQGVSGVAGVAAGFAGGLNSDSFNAAQQATQAAQKAGTGVKTFGQKASMFGSFGNQALGMFGGNQQPLWQQGEQRQELLNSPDYLAMKEQQNQAYVNQGLSFASHGGNINNNSLNLQNSMRGKYNSYKNRYSKGGTFQKFGINEIPDSAGLHHQNAYGGVPIGPNAMAEGGEFVLDGNYVVSDQVDGMNNQTDEFGRTMAENLKRDLSKYTMRDLNSKNRDSLRRPMDPLAEQTINQIKQKAMMETEMARAEAQAKEQERQAMVEGALQYAAAGGKLNKDITKIVEEEYAAAYGGQINPKKYKGLNMPGYSKGGKLPKEVLRARVESHMSPQEADAYVNQYGEGGGIHIKESKKGTFTAAATKHGKSVQEFARQVLANKENYSSAMVKKANFARNAASWKHAQGGPLYGNTDSKYTYSHGGPVVSNVNQDFDLYAQNRGGMMMAEGGNMYAMGGPDGISGFDLSPNEYNMMIDQYQNPLPIIESMQPKNLQQLPTNNTMPGLVGNIEPFNYTNLPTNPNDTSISIPSIQSTIPGYDIQRKNFQNPLNSNIPMPGEIVGNVENMPALSEDATYLSPLQKYLANNYPESLNKLKFLEAEDEEENMFEYGTSFKPVTNNQSENTPQPNQGLTGLDYASMGMQALGPLSQLYYGLKGPDDVNYERIKADKIDPYRAITLANEESRRAQDTAGYNLRQNAPTSGSYMANMRALGLGAGKQRGAQTAATQYQADVANTQMQNQVNAQNAQISMQEQIDRLQEKDAARTNVTEGLSGMGSSTANMIRDYRTNQVNQTIANNIGTNNFKLDTANKTITYRGDDGKTYTIPLESVLPNNYKEQSNTPQFQRDFGESLNRGFRNRFSGPNAGK